MNRQKPPHGIEWTRINGRPGYTWNPTAGCLHGCTWRMPDGSTTECYAKTVAEGLARHAYPEGFEHHYFHPDRLGEPLKVKEPSGIFVGSMADLFGHWVPDWQIHQVIATMYRADWHIFQTLTKYPNRLRDFVFPDNVWAGVSLPAGHLMSAEGGARALRGYLSHIANIAWAETRFLSIEPLWFDVAPVLANWLGSCDELPFQWAIIGAASKGRRVYQPKTQWVADLLDVLDEAYVPVFFKGNLDVPGTGRPGGHNWREEFPI